MRKKLKTDNGITLIALVVTIVVLIILATISVNALFGENGIIKEAQSSKNKHTNTMESVEDRMDDLYSEYLNSLQGSGSSSGSGVGTVSAGQQVTKPSSWTTLSGTAISDGNGGTVPLPSGFYYVGGDINTGLVISSKQGDTLTASGTSMGNQFVWIPVKSTSYFPEESYENTDYTNSIDSNSINSINTINSLDTNSITSGSVDTEYSTMRSKVLKYGGFYRGRYEAGVNTTSLRTGSTSIQTVVSKKGVAPYNHVAWSNAVSAAANMYSGSAISTMCYSEQWRAMCAYIGDASRTATDKSAAELTGSVSSDVSKNIYDLAGNCGEWSTEEGTLYSGEGTIHKVWAMETFFVHYLAINETGNEDNEYGWPDPVSKDYIGFRVCLYVN